MKAWTFSYGGYPQALHETDLPDDKSPLRPTEVRIKVKAASLNPVDAQLMGNPLLGYIPNFLLQEHKCVGEDFSSIVEEAGASSGYTAGDEVFGIVYFFPSGSLSEKITVDTNSPGKAIVLPKPIDWSFEEAAALPLVWLTAQTTIAAVEPYIQTNKLAVLGGSSSCGMYVSHIAKQRGWQVIASCSGSKADFARSMGADEIIDYTTTSVPDKIREFAPDAIIDCVGGSDCVGLAKRYVTIVGDKTSAERLAMGGRYTYLSNPQMLSRALCGRVGLGPSYTCINLEYKDAYLKEALTLPKNKIIIDSVFDFDQVREAFERLNTGRVKGKVVVQVAP
ncbi:hypothetical protein G7054_g8910 [Neopestalotiopsis clavispora]|nr:hypothetical protein G7054_g8910 [Neopestalotiopsis clavispora]